MPELVRHVGDVRRLERADQRPVLGVELDRGPRLAGDQLVEVAQCLAKVVTEPAAHGASSTLGVPLAAHLLLGELVIPLGQLVHELLRLLVLETIGETLCVVRSKRLKDLRVLLFENIQKPLFD